MNCLRILLYIRAHEGEYKSDIIKACREKRLFTSESATYRAFKLLEYCGFIRLESDNPNYHFSEKRVYIDW